MIVISHIIALFMGILYYLTLLLLIKKLRSGGAHPYQMLLLAVFSLVLAPPLISFFWEQISRSHFS